MDLCGIASVDRFNDSPPARHPTQILPGCKSVIVIAQRLLDGVTQINFRAFEDLREDLKGIYGTYGYTMLPNFALTYACYAPRPDHREDDRRGRDAHFDGPDDERQPNQLAPCGRRRRAWGIRLDEYCPHARIWPETALWCDFNDGGDRTRSHVRRGNALRSDEMQNMHRHVPHKSHRLYGSEDCHSPARWVIRSIHTPRLISRAVRLRRTASARSLAVQKTL